MEYRLAYLAYTEVNWCEALGTVLANDEVVNGVSERGGFPVVKKKMRQWSLRITEYAERLLSGLEQIDFSDSLKEIQRNWIGKSYGAEIDFPVKSEKNLVRTMRVFTTRPDTIFGVDFMVVAPEHEMVQHIVSAAQQQAADEYLQYVQSRSEVERMAEVKKITGCFTGAYAVNPLNGREIPIWISEYVLAGYGTGAIMGVPCGDERDHKFARHFQIPITNIIGKHYNGEDANPTKDAILENSDFLDGMVMRKAIDVVINKVEEMGIGKRQVNYKMRDAGWSRQRYWGEPFPVVFRDDVPYAMDEKDLPLELPPSDDFKPSGTGEGPLANVKDWVYISENERRDTNTMPTHAGAAWYFMRYADPHNDKAFADRKALDYWNQVDVYIGGAEHAVAHLLYSRPLKS
jgi:leucyl-tRNA synthetase